MTCCDGKDLCWKVPADNGQEALVAGVIQQKVRSSGKCTHLTMQWPCCPTWWLALTSLTAYQQHVLVQVQQVVSTAAGILPQTQGQAQLTDPQQTPKPASAQWNAPVDTRKVSFSGI